MKKSISDFNCNLSYKIATEGMVLLKNPKNILPIPKEANVYLFGKYDEIIYGGTGSGDVHSSHTISVYDGFKFQELNGRIKGISTGIDLKKDITINEKDVAVYLLTRLSGEFKDREPIEGDFFLSANEKEEILELTKRFKKVVVVLNVCGVTETKWLKALDIGLLVSYYPGMEAGRAIADVLLGIVNPSGRLVDTWCSLLGNYSTTKSFLQSPDFVNYNEGVFVGYRHFQTSNFRDVDFPFGYGLSYTSFSKKIIEAIKKKDRISFLIEVENIGDFPGKEVVQIYCKLPKGKLHKPRIVLGCFTKTNELKADEKQTVSIDLFLKDISSFNTLQNSFVLESGPYDFYLSDNVECVGKTKKFFSFNLEKDKVVEKCKARLDLNQIDEKNQNLMVTKRFGLREFVIYSEGPTHLSCEKAMTDLPVENSESKHIFYDGDSNPKVIKAKENHILKFPIFVQKKGSYLIAIRTNCINDINDALSIHGKKISLTTSDRNNLAFTGSIILNLEQGFQWLDCTILKNGFEISDFVLIKKKKTKKDEKISKANYSEDDLFNHKCSVEEFVSTLDVVSLIRLACGHHSNILGTTGSIGDFESINKGDFFIETADGPAGIRIDPNNLGNYFADFEKGKKLTEIDFNKIGYPTAFPSSTLLASTFDLKLAFEMGEAIAFEAKRYGINCWLAPAINIHRNPLCGRNFEYFSEDPLVAGYISSELIKGVESKGIATSVKHFCVNNKEQNRNNSISYVSARALREIYLRQFEIVIKNSLPFSIMSSYNLMNDVECSENPELLTVLLRKEWAFKGIVMTDWCNNSINAIELLAGNNVKMPKGDNSLYSAYKIGLVDLDDLRRNAITILTALKNLRVRDV